MSLLDEITEDLTNSSSSTADVLRKARVIAFRLKSPELKKWTHAEMSGYEQGDTLPDYRQRYLQLRGTFQGLLQFREDDVIIPTMSLPGGLRELATKLEVTDSAASLAEMIRTEDQEFRRVHHPELTAHIAKYFKPDQRVALTNSYLLIPKYVLTGVLDNIKSRLLEFILTLQENDVDPNSPKAGGSDAQLVGSYVVNIIYGSNNLVAIGDNINQQVSNVQQGNIESLIEHLKEFGVPEEDLEQLKDAITADPETTDGHFGPKVTSWIAGVIAKAASGVWNVSMSAAAQALQKALEAYYMGAMANVASQM